MAKSFPDWFLKLPAAARVYAKKLQLEPLPHEGGLFRNTLATESASAIYYLLAGNDFSALHWLKDTEIYHWYAGSPLQLVVLDPAGGGYEVTLGNDVASGQLPQQIIPGGMIHGSLPLGEWTLVGTTMSPGFSWEGFKLAERSELLKTHPEFELRIQQLTRD